ncbi:regulator of G-protein signaling 3 isoform X2 [Syngnathus scovelli]|uniref:regulator of G-protein signaling 3 isoform X2 n=1 Tax=Syngnathus scovelli TaxID=161590 RepID=UPI002110B3BF|nr:regulator of G-protein signaling 3 isoform X2 [Syngnathus scovelli]
MGSHHHSTIVSSAVAMFWKHTSWSWHDDGGDDRYHGENRGEPLDCRHCDDARAIVTLPDPKRPTDSAAGTAPLSGTLGGDADPDARRRTKRVDDRDTRQRPERSVDRDGERDAATRQRVSVTRGLDGFGFTICCDGPVRVQAVDTGGPAHRSGLRRGDALLQLNGLPVEMWKCGELAHAIRSCPSRIILVVRRGSPVVRTCSETLLRLTAAGESAAAPLHQPAPGKHGRCRRRRGSLVSSGLGVLGSLWRDRKEDKEEEKGGEEPPCTSTLKGTRVTSSQGDNYIILEQLTHPVFEDRSTTLGRPYQSHHPGRALAYEPTDSVGPRPSSAVFSTLQGYRNNQATSIWSHGPSCGGAGEAPKALILPICAEPVDPRGPDTTTPLMSKEMIHHRARRLPHKLSASPSELGLFLPQPSRASSPPAAIAWLPSDPTLSPVWKEKKCLGEELGSASRSRGLRRCLSEGSLRARPERTRSLSDIHRLTLDLHALRPSAQSLKNEPSSEGAAPKQTLTWLRGAQDVEIGKELRKKSKSLYEHTLTDTNEVKWRCGCRRSSSEASAGLSLLGSRRERWLQSDSLERALRNTRPSAREVQTWAQSLQTLLAHPYGLALFRHFLRSEYSEENLDFWLAVEKFKATRLLGQMADGAAHVYEGFVSRAASRQVKVDSKVREMTRRSLRLGIEDLQDGIFGLMEADSYPRFLRSRLYAQLANQEAGLAHPGRLDSARAPGPKRSGEVAIL